MRIIKLAGTVIIGLLLVFNSAACDGEEERRLAEPVSFGYLGVNGSSIGSFTCASCHPDTVADWSETDHAGTFAALSQPWLGQDYSADPLCVPCHVTGYDPFASNAGYDERVGADRIALQNVQCESCHGPASFHNGNVTQIAVSWEADVCAACHSNPFPAFDEWSTSAHSGSLSPQNGMVAELAECQRCHSAQGFVRYFVEQRQIDPAFNSWELAPISCVACHDPHRNNSSPGSAQLRIAGTVRFQGVPVSVGNGAVCILCHQLTGVPGEEISQSQSNLYLGIGGHEYPGMGPYPDGAHTAFQNACVACHLSFNKEPWMGPGTAAETGHDFRPSLKACQVCHTNAVVWDISANMDYNCNSAIEGVQIEIGALLNQLSALLGGGPSPDPFDADDTTVSDYDKAAFNYYVVLNDRSGGIHNGPYAARLLQDSICSLDPLAALCTDPTCKP